MVDVFSGKVGRHEIDQEARIKELHAKIGHNISLYEPWSFIAPDLGTLPQTSIDNLLLLA